MVRICSASLYDAKGIAYVINSVIAEGNLTIMDKQFTTREEKGFIASMSSREAIFVAKVKSEIVGVQGVYLYSKMNTLGHVAEMGTWIRKDYRGKGIGELLARKSFNFARKNGFEKIFIGVMAHNKQALAFYRKIGFRKVGIAEKQVKLKGTYHNEVYMEKFL
jgi:RimJ/RimL family protein N-acetyltransferase